MRSLGSRSRGSLRSGWEASDDRRGGGRRRRERLAIHYYERHGILPQPARVEGKRRYDDEVLERLSVLEVAKQAGFSLEEIRVLFEATDGGAPAHTQLKELARRKLPEVDALIAHATEVKMWLEATDRCTCDHVYPNQPGPRSPACR